MPYQGYTVKADDGDGHTDATTVTILDTSPPVVTITSPVNGSVVTDTSVTVVGPTSSPKAQAEFEEKAEDLVKHAYA